MMQFMLCNGTTTQVGGKELLQNWSNDSNSWIWVDLFEESVEDEQEFLRETFSLDNKTVSEAQRKRHPPSFEGFDDYIFLLLKPLDAESNTLDFNTLQLAMFFNERFLITRRSKFSPYLDNLWKNMESKGCTDEQPISIVSAMCRRVTHRYGDILLNLEERLDVIEDELLDSPTDTLMKELVEYNTSLRKMHRILTYYVDIFFKLQQYLSKTGNSRHDDFDDIYALLERFNSLSAMYQNVITDLIEAYISLNGHRLNQIMKVLTVVTVIFVPLTLLVGIYGMNFENMPELKSKHGYFILLSVMGGIAGVLLYIFRKMRWL